MKFTPLVLVILCLPLGCRSAPTKPVRSDVCVYGGTSAGVAAAMQAARMGKKVTLVEPGFHLGGLTSGGLGATDVGNEKAIGGISREFYREVGKKYGKDVVWEFEPHIAEQVFWAMATKAKVQVKLGQGLLEVRKDKDGNLTEIVTADRGPDPGIRPGLIFQAKVFIDATYEGDLMAAAKVDYTVGREANPQYGETLNGVCKETPKHQFRDGDKVIKVDPYKKPKDPASGLIPLVSSGDPGKAGEGDEKSQSYNYRLCLTRDSRNMKPILPPGDYDPARYELLARYIEELDRQGKKTSLDQFLSIRPIPNGKTDVNNNGAVSTDFIGGNWGENWDYARANEETRAQIRLEHEKYIRGLLRFLATSPRLPRALRDEMSSYGLANDEFDDNGNWPRQIYVREARRMVSDYVMTEQNCRGERKEKVTDPVGMASYGMDSHNCQRIVRSDDKGAWVENEGDVQVPVSAPYPISYKSIVPKPGQCPNLLVPVCLSATHIAYGSIRMEPVFMVLGQSAATAACLAIDGKTSVQKVEYAKLKERLLKDGQVLEIK